MVDCSLGRFCIKVDQDTASHRPEVKGKTHMIHRTIFVFGMSMLFGGLVSLSMALEKTAPIPKTHQQPTIRHAYGHMFSCPSLLANDPPQTKSTKLSWSCDGRGDGD